MKPRSFTPECLTPRSSSRATAWRNVACESANARWCTSPGSRCVARGAGVRSSFVKIVISRPSPGSKYRWLSFGLSRFGCSNTNGIPSRPSQKSIEVWRPAPTSVMWCTPWLWILRMGENLVRQQRHGDPLIAAQQDRPRQRVGPVAVADCVKHGVERPGDLALERQHELRRAPVGQVAEGDTEQADAALLDQRHGGREQA